VAALHVGETYRAARPAMEQAFAQVWTATRFAIGGAGGRANSVFARQAMNTGLTVVSQLIYDRERTSPSRPSAQGEDGKCLTVLTADTC
jgi:hypothetical protein